MTRKIDPVILLRRLKRELRESIDMLERAPRYAREEGQLAALRHVEAFLRNQEPVTR